MSEEVRIIKKYPNRRLYDTDISSYITLADVKMLVLEGVRFKVVDAKSGDEITRNILLQIISEEEDGGEPIFSSELLCQIIRFYGNSMQRMLSKYLEKSMELFMQQQKLFQDQSKTFTGNNPMNVMSQIAERNMALWQQMSKSFFDDGKDK